MIKRSRLYFYFLTAIVVLGLGVAVRLQATSTPQAKWTVISDYSASVKDPALSAGLSTIIVEARAVRKAAPASIKGFQNPESKLPVHDFAWQDVLFDQVNILWKDQDAPAVGDSLYVRTYNAETPEVSLKDPNAPEFAPGEKYILFLTERDVLAYSAGNPHWMPVSGRFGVFQLSGDNAARKAPAADATFSRAELSAAIERGVADPHRIAMREHLRRQTKGIRLK